MNLLFLLPGLATGSVLALGLWLLFRIVPRIAPDIRAWSWRLVLLKLAVSTFAIGQISLHLLPALPPPSERRSLPSPPSISQGTMELDAPALVENPNPAAAVDLATPIIHNAPKSSGINLRQLIFSFWIAGFALRVARALLMTIRTRRDLKVASPIANPEILQCFESLSRRAGLRRIPQLVTLECAQSPMVYGIWRPIIVLPPRLTSNLSADVELAIGHEIAHIRRGDLIWSGIAWVVRSILFFNPVAWLADNELRASQESATDQEAVWITGASVAAYAKMLLSSMSPDRVAWQPTGLAMFDSFVSSQRRLRAMQQFSQRPRWTQKMMVTGLIIIGVGCMPTYSLVRAAVAVRPPQEHGDEVRATSGQRRSKSANGAHDTTPVQATSKSRATSRAKDHSRTATATKLAAASKNARLTTELTELASRKARPTRPNPDVKFVEEASNVSTLPRSVEFKEASEVAANAYNDRVSKLISDQDNRIIGYRRGADQREREAEQREREGQERKREGEQRARAALLREQVIEEHERNGYQFVGPGQRETDAQIRRDDARQRKADQYQGVLDQKQRETDQWQREFDERSISAMRKETQADIAAARTQYQKRISELVADEASRRKEAAGAAAYSETQAKLKSGNGLHEVKTQSGLSFAIPDGYDVVRVQTVGKDSYTVVLKHKKS